MASEERTVIVLLSTSSRRWILAAAFSIACVIPLAGCNRGPAMYHVKGHVFYKDGTVPAGAIRVVLFRPSKDSTAHKAASGAIDPDGSFEMWTKTTGDGVAAGEYDVGFTILKSPRDATPLIKEEYATPGGAAGSIKVDHDIDDLKFVIEPLPGVTGAPSTAGG